MRSQSLILFICFLPSVLCVQDKCFLINVLCGIVILIMGIVIIALSITVYLLKKTQQLSASTVNSNEQLTSFTQESKTDAISHKASGNNNLNDKSNNDGSPLHVTIDIKEIGGEVEPNNHLYENNKTSNVLKPVGQMIFKKEEMDKVINEVKIAKRLLKSRQTNESGDLIDVSALKNQNIDNCHKNSRSVTEMHIISNDSDEKVNANDFTINLKENQTEIAGKNIKAEKNQSIHRSNIEISSETIDGRKDKMPVVNNEEQGIYHTLPKSVSRRDFRKSFSVGVETLHDYDYPYRKSQNVKNKRTVIIDQETGYDVILSEHTSGFGNYVNARTVE